MMKECKVKKENQSTVDVYNWLHLADKRLAICLYATVASLPNYQKLSVGIGGTLNFLDPSFIGSFFEASWSRKLGLSYEGQWVENIHISKNARAEGKAGYQVTG